jgi:penicillin-insensitive murein endopeptidase
MTWKPGELWLDTDVLWFREHAVALAPSGFDAAALAPAATGLAASRQRRQAAEAARRRRRHATRTVPAVALVVGSATMLPIAWLRHGDPARGARPLQEDPPSLTHRLGELTLAAETPVRVASVRASRPSRAAPAPEPVSDFANVHWHSARSVGLPYAGYLVGGTQLPVSGPDWVTWDPVTDSVPNLPKRLYGNPHTIRTVISVIRDYRAAHPYAPKVVVGDISRRGGGVFDEHVSHQNGLDVDVYYPRRDKLLRAPIAVGQIDRRLAQDLLDRFVRAGAQMIFIGYSTGLHGPGGVVMPWPNHDNHMHVRFPPRS